MKRLETKLNFLLLASFTFCQLGCSREPLGEAPLCVEQSPSLAAASEHPRGAEFQRALEQTIDAGLPGAVMAIRDKDGTWEGAAGSADLARGTPLETCHATRIASVTKPFIAVTTMKLVEQGLLDLDTTVAEYLPDERHRLPHADHITLRQLLSHTSGVHNFIDLNFILKLMNRPSRTWSMKEAYDHALKSKPEFDPGTSWSYSNTNFLLVAWIIEAVTHKTHEGVLQQLVLDSLALSSTSYHPDQFDFPGITHGYFDLFGDGAFVDASYNYANSCVGPDGGMVSTAHDLLVFIDTLLAKQEFLSKASLKAMAPTVPTDEEHFPEYGLGLEAWEEDGVRGIGHGGHEFGYRTFVYYFPEQDISFVLWFNASSLNPMGDNISNTIEAQRLALRNLVLDLN